MLPVSEWAGHPTIVPIACGSPGSSTAGTGTDPGSRAASRHLCTGGALAAGHPRLAEISPWRCSSRGCPRARGRGHHAPSRHPYRVRSWLSDPDPVGPQRRRRSHRSRPGPGSDSSMASRHVRWLGRHRISPVVAARGSCLPCAHGRTEAMSARNRCRPSSRSRLAGAGLDLETDGMTPWRIMLERGNPLASAADAGGA